MKNWSPAIPYHPLRDGAGGLSYFGALSIFLLFAYWNSRRDSISAGFKSGVARFFFVHDTKTGKMYQMNLQMKLHRCRNFQELRLK
jgi:hypothetical protein